MKKSILSIALLSMLFVLGACSATEGDFLDKVKGKYVYISETSEEGVNDFYGQFSANGKKYNINEGPSMDIDKATDENTATYSVTESGVDVTYTFTTSDGKKGTFKVPNLSVRDVWYTSTKRK